MTVNKIYVLVHPNFHIDIEEKYLMDEDKSVVYAPELMLSSEAEASEKWLRIALKAAKSDSTLFIIFSGFNLERAEKVINSYRENGKTLPPELEQLKENVELEKRRRDIFKETLAGKLIEVQTEDPKLIDWDEYFSALNIQFDPKMKIFAFGEYAEACIHIYGSGFAEIMESRCDELTLKILDDISLSTYDVVQQEIKMNELTNGEDRILENSN